MKLLQKETQNFKHMYKPSTYIAKVKEMLFEWFSIEGVSSLDRSVLVVLQGVTRDSCIPNKFANLNELPINKILSGSH